MFFNENISLSLNCSFKEIDTNEKINITSCCVVISHVSLVRTMADTIILLLIIVSRLKDWLEDYKDDKLMYILNYDKNNPLLEFRY